MRAHVSLGRLAHLRRDRARDAELRRARHLEPVVLRVEHREHRRHPSRRLLGEGEPQTGVAREHVAEEQVPEDAVRVPAQLDDEHRGCCRVATEVGRGLSGVVVDRHVEVFARGPDRLVLGCIEGWKTRIGRHPREQDAPEQVGTPRTLDLLDRVVDVVEEDLCDPRPAAGRLGAEVGEPPVVGLDPGEAVVVVVTTDGLVRRQETGGEERRDRVREQHLGDHAVVLELLGTTLRVPVAVGLRTAQIVERVLVRRRPVVELVVPLHFEVLAVVEHRRAGMTVGRDHDVTVVAELHHQDSPRYAPRSERVFEATPVSATPRGDRPSHST